MDFLDKTSSFTDLIEGVNLYNQGDLGYKEINELEEGLLMEKQGWQAIKTLNEIKLISPNKTHLSEEDLTNPKGLKFGDDYSILRLEGARYLYLYNKYIN